MTHLAQQQSQQIANASALNAIGTPASPASPTHMSHNNSSNVNRSNCKSNSSSFLLTHFKSDFILKAIITNIFCYFFFINTIDSLSQNVSQPSSHVSAAASALHSQLSAFHQQEHKMLLHNALNRTVSHQPGANDVVSLMNTLMDIGHRKLERTQSEPLPQVNTSR